MRRVVDKQTEFTQRVYEVAKDPSLSNRQAKKRLIELARAHLSQLESDGFLFDNGWSKKGRVIGNVKINPGLVGVVIAAGKIQSRARLPGRHFVFPLWEIKTLNTTIQGFNDSYELPCKSGLLTTISIKLRYSLLPEKAPWIYERTMGNYSELLIEPIILQVAREILSQTEETKVIGEAIRSNIAQTLIIVLEKIGFRMNQVAIQTRLPEPVEKIVYANRQAEVKRAKAHGTADATRINAGANAYAAGLMNSPEVITPELLRRISLEHPGSLNAMAASRIADKVIDLAGIYLKRQGRI
ncbi:MAG: SPFH domain-containing protein [Candidatus Micrarchaeota archaeon]|nr:SPFH domain-containing protein [Candidatus Micrarchaeota archaeon]